MKTFRKELLFEIPRRRQFVNITPQVAECERASGIREGLALVNAMHISESTASTASPAAPKKTDAK